MPRIFGLALILSLAVQGLAAGSRPEKSAQEGDVRFAVFSLFDLVKLVGWFRCVCQNCLDFASSASIADALRSAGFGQFRQAFISPACDSRLSSAARIAVLRF